jgi:hypothetical protein
MIATTNATIPQKKLQKFDKCHHLNSGAVAVAMVAAEAVGAAAAARA